MATFHFPFPDIKLIGDTNLLSEKNWLFFINYLREKRRFYNGYKADFADIRRLRFSWRFDSEKIKFDIDLSFIILK